MKKNIMEFSYKHAHFAVLTANVTNVVSN